MVDRGRRAHGFVTRPEGVLFFIALMIHWAVQRVCSKRGRLICSAAILVGIFLVVVGPYQLFRMIYYKDILPNTFYAKPMTEDLSLGLSDVWDWLIEQGWGIAFLAGLIGLMASSPLRKRAVLSGFLGISALIFFSATHPDWMPGFRFLAPATPLLVILIVLGYQRTDEFLSRDGEGFLQHLRGLVIPLCILGMVIWGVMNFGSLWEEEGWRANYTYDSRLKFGNWLDNHTPEDILIAYGDMGAFPYAAWRRFIDYYGLINRDIAYMKHSGEATRMTITEYVLSHEPDMVIDAFAGITIESDLVDLHTDRINLAPMLEQGYDYVGHLIAYPPDRHKPHYRGRSVVVLINRNSVLWEQREYASISPEGYLQPAHNILSADLVSPTSLSKAGRCRFP